MSTTQHGKRRLRVWGILLAPLLLFLAACSSPPADLQGRSDTITEQLSATDGVIDANKKSFNGLLEESRYSFAGDYTKEQLHQDRFDQAAAKLEEASKAYDERVKPHLGSSYDEANRADLDAALTEVELLIAEANTLAADPLAWVERVAQTKEQTEEFVDNARTASNAIVADLALLGQDTTAAGQTFPAQVSTISTKVAPLEETRDAALAAITDIDTEFAKPQPNFAVLATSLTEIEALSGSYAELSKTLRSDLKSLPSSETRTLLDFRVDSFLEVSRTSWDEGSDAFTDVDYEYDLGLTDQEAASYFADKIGQVVAVDDYWGGFNLAEGIDQAMWDKLKIDPGEAWPSDWHNTAEYFIDGLEDTYCQKVKVFRDGKPDSSARPDPNANYCSQYDKPGDLTKGIFWEEAEEFNAEAIGMDIYSKAYGDFGDQATTAATPPGMAYVGDPTTGEWREDSNGNSFWHYYGQYAFFSQLIGGPNAYHYRSEYDTWNSSYRRDNEPYYATAGGSARYGAHSPQVSSRFPSSAFVDTGLSTATVRNAGPAARAGGPGNGGK